MFISNTIKTEVVTVTPEMARKLLEQNTRNRKVSKGNYAQVLEAMTAGEWELNGEAIKIARDGTLLDGQHRCLVSAENDIPFQTLIVYGLPANTQDTMDTGKSRSAADVLSIEGYPSANNLASITIAIIRSERWNLKAAVSTSNSFNAITPKQVLARVQEEPSLVDLSRYATSVRKCGLSAKLSGVLFYHFSKIDQDDAEHFFNTLRDGEGLERGNPIHTLREQLLSLKNNVRGSANTAYLAAITIKAWNKYRLGEECRQLKYRPGGANPEKFPEAI